MWVWPRSPRGGGPPMGPASGGWRKRDSWRENGRAFPGAAARLLVAVTVLPAVFGGLRPPIAALARGDLGGVHLTRGPLRPVRGQGGGRGPRSRSVRRPAGRR